MIRSMAVAITVIASWASVGSACAQQVRGFIDPARADQPPAFSSDADREYLKAFAKLMGVTASTAGEIGNCQWRSPLQTPGAYVDAAQNGDMEFYARIPFPTSGLKMENARLLRRPELAEVAYLELRGSLKSDSTTGSWEFVDLVVPPMAAAGGLPPMFTVATGTAGSYRLRQLNFRPIVPGAPIRVNIVDYMPDLVTGLRGDGRFRMRLSRFLDATRPDGPRVSLEADFSRLPRDLDDIFVKLKAMQAASRADRCAVFASTCFDGRCG